MRDVSQQMMRASTSFAEGTFLFLQRRALARAKQSANCASSAAQSEFCSFFGCSLSLFLSPSYKILEIKEKGGEKEVSMFLRTKRVFSTTKSKERKRGRRFSALRDRKRERENDPRA
jgi:hypothetical protein